MSFYLILPHHCEAIRSLDSQAVAVTTVERTTRPVFVLIDRSHGKLGLSRSCCVHHYICGSFTGQSTCGVLVSVVVVIKVLSHGTARLGAERYGTAPASLHALHRSPCMHWIALRRVATNVNVTHRNAPLRAGSGVKEPFSLLGLRPSSLNAPLVTPHAAWLSFS